MTTYVLTSLLKPSAVPQNAPSLQPLFLAPNPNSASKPVMAPVEISHAASRLPFIAALSHHALILYLSSVALHTIYRSYAALPPSASTRHRQPLRKGYIRTFSILAIVSLVSAAFFGVKSASLSYRVWATERGIELPEGFFGDKGGLRPGYHPGRFQSVQWLSDTPFYRDTLEIIAETARYAWWGQQIDIGTVSWSLYLALEGQRRNISNLWSFLVLSQLVNLSYAQSLFFLAVLLTPVPLQKNAREITRAIVPATSNLYSRTLEKFFPTKPAGFLPAPGLYISLLFVNFGAVFLVPYVANTSSFVNIALVARLAPFTFLLLPYVIPSHWGKTHHHPHEAHNNYIFLFRIISLISAALHVNTSAIALFRNTPEKSYYRHSLLHPFKEEHRSAIDRTTTALSQVFGAILEHPAVTAVGMDVLLSGLTLGTWAGIRGLDAYEMLVSSIPFTQPIAKRLEDIEEVIKETPLQTEISPPRRRVGRPRKNESTANTNKATSTSVSKHQKSVSNGSNDHRDPSYHPNAEVIQEGEENAEEDWEASALAWGMISVGGLGLGSAAVYGAEVLAR